MPYRPSYRIPYRPCQTRRFSSVSAIPDDHAGDRRVLEWCNSRQCPQEVIGQYGRYLRIINTFMIGQNWVDRKCLTPYADRGSWDSYFNEGQLIPELQVERKGDFKSKYHNEHYKWALHLYSGAALCEMYPLLKDNAQYLWYLKLWFREENYSAVNSCSLYEFLRVGEYSQSANLQLPFGLEYLWYTLPMGYVCRDVDTPYAHWNLSFVTYFWYSVWDASFEDKRLENKGCFYRKSGWDRSLLWKIFPMVAHGTFYFNFLLSLSRVRAGTGWVIRTDGVVGDGQVEIVRDYRLAQEGSRLVYLVEDISRQINRISSTWTTPRIVNIRYRQHGWGVEDMDLPLVRHVPKQSPTYHLRLKLTQDIRELLPVMCLDEVSYRIVQHAVRFAESREDVWVKWMWHRLRTSDAYVYPRVDLYPKRVGLWYRSEAVDARARHIERQFSYHDRNTHVAVWEQRWLSDEWARGSRTGQGGNKSSRFRDAWSEDGRTGRTHDSSQQHKRDPHKDTYMPRPPVGIGEYRDIESSEDSGPRWPYMLALTCGMFTMLYWWLFSRSVRVRRSRHDYSTYVWLLLALVVMDICVFKTFKAYYLVGLGMLWFIYMSGSFTFSLTFGRISS